VTKSENTSLNSHPLRIVTIGLAGFIGLLIIALFVASFFIDGMISVRTESAMNEKLKGYHVTLSRAHLQMLGGTLSLKGLKIIQEKNPSPPVADFPLMRFSIEWSQLFSGKVVANVLLWHPHVHIDQRQFHAEETDRTSAKKKGWQEALENVYPFKINRFHIEDATFTYIQDAHSQPLHADHLNLLAENIRNIHAPSDLYPSHIHVDMVIFGHGKALIEGRANFLMEPFPGMKADYRISDIPLGALTPEIKTVNVTMTGGTFASRGYVEYSPKVTNVRVDNATIEKVRVSYVHTAQSNQAEAQRVTEAGHEVQKENNRPAVHVDLKELDIRDSSFYFVNREKNPSWHLDLTDSDMTIRNFSNHEQNGPARVDLHGRFMGSGSTRATGHFLPAQRGPEFNLNLAIENTDVTSLNPLLHAYGRMEVAAGQFSLYSQLGVKNDEMSGYVKPLFANLEVYGSEQEKHKTVLHKAKELMIGGAAHLLKNSKTQNVATVVPISGRLKNPDVSTWQAFVEVLQNAFVQAILPGFDRSVRG
jgi:Domain of Unknown Function (DUF748)